MKNSVANQYDLNASYDTDQAKLIFDETLRESDHVMHLSGYLGRGTDMIVISENVSLNSPYYTKTQLKQYTVEELMELHEKIYEQCPYYDNKRELVELLEEVSIADYYNMIRREERWHSIECDFVSRGYVQSDVIKIVFHKMKPWEKQKVDRILWDAPFLLTVTDNVTGEYIYLEEYLSDQYDYDRDKVLNELRKYPNLDNALLDWLGDSLPNSIC